MTNDIITPDEAPDFPDLSWEGPIKPEDYDTMTHSGKSVIQGRFTEAKLAEKLGQKGFKHEGLDDFSTRASIGWANDDDFASKSARFKEAYPRGEIRETEHGIVFRTEPGKTWDFVDPGFFTKFEPLNDLADLSGAAPALAGETLAAFMIPEQAAVRSIPFAVPALQALGASAGEAIHQFNDRDSTTPYGDKLRKAGMEGLWSFGGTTAGGWVGRRLHGEGIWDVTSKDRDIVKFAKDNPILKDMLPTQAANNPMWHRLGSQAETASSLYRNYKVAQNESGVEFGRSLVDRSNLVPDVLQVMGDAVRTRKEQIVSMLTVPKTSWEEAGKLVTGVVEKYARESQENVKVWYEHAKSLGSASFDLSSVIAKAENITGSHVPVHTPTPEKTHEVFGAPSAKLQEIITKLKNITPILQDTVDPNGKRLTAMDQLVDIRRELFELTQPDIAGGKKPDKLALELYGELNEALKNPISGNPLISKAWKDAMDLAKERFDDLESFNAMQLWRTATKDSGMTSAEAAAALVRPNRGEWLDEVEKMSNIANDGSFEKLKDAFKSSLVEGARTGQDIIKKLDEWRDDPHGLSRLLTDDEINIFRRMGDDLNRLRASGLQETIDRFTKMGGDLLSARGGIKGTLGNAEPRMVDEMNKAFGPAEYGKIKAGLMNYIIESSIEKKGTEQIINAKKLRSLIEQAQESGAKDYLNPDDIVAMENLAIYTQMTNRSIDGGSAMVGGQQVAALNPFHKGVATAVGGLFKMLGANRGYGIFLMSRPARRILIGDGSNPSSVWGFQLTGALLSSTVQEALEETDRAFSK